MVSMAATLSLNAQSAAGQIRRLSPVNMLGGFAFAASGMSAQQRGWSDANAHAALSFVASGTVSQIVLDYELRVDPRVLIMVPAENRTVILGTENRSFTIPIDDRRAK